MLVYCEIKGENKVGEVFYLFLNYGVVVRFSNSLCISG